MCTSRLDVSSQSDCLFTISAWMYHTYLKSDKVRNQFLEFPPKPISPAFFPISVDGNSFLPVAPAKYLGTRDISHSLTHYSQAIGRFRHEYLQNACITWSFSTISMALTLIQDISHLDNCNSLLKWFSKFCFCTLLSLLNTLKHPLNKIQIFPFSAPNLLKTSHHNYSKIRSPSDDQPGPHNLTINSISDITF